MRYLVPLLALLTTTPAYAAEPQWTVQVDPLTTALGFVHVQVEHTLGPDFSAYLGPSLHLFNGLGSDEREYIGYGAEAGIRWFPQGHSPTGWWVQARGVLAHIEATDTGVTDIGGYGSVLGGYTAIFDGWFVVSGGLGGQYLAYSADGAGVEGFLPAAHTTVGVAF